MENQLGHCLEGVDSKQGFQFPQVKKEGKKVFSIKRLHSLQGKIFTVPKIALKNTTLTHKWGTLKLKDVIFF